MPAGVGYGPEMPPDAMMAGMDALLAGGPGGMPGGPPGMPPDATVPPSNEGGIEAQVIATLAEENAQLRALIGLGPDDPVPMPQASAPAPGPGPVGL